MKPVKAFISSDGQLFQDKTKLAHHEISRHVLGALPDEVDLTDVSQRTNLAQTITTALVANHGPVREALALLKPKAPKLTPEEKAAKKAEREAKKAAKLAAKKAAGKSK